jgi:hypothetical protein
VLENRTDSDTSSSTSASDSDTPTSSASASQTSGSQTSAVNSQTIGACSQLYCSAIPSDPLSRTSGTPTSSASASQTSGSQTLASNSHPIRYTRSCIAFAFLITLSLAQAVPEEHHGHRGRDSRRCGRSRYHPYLRFPSASRKKAPRQFDHKDRPISEGTHGPLRTSE